MSLQPSRQCDSSLHEQSDGKSDFTTSTLEHCVQRFSEKEIHRLGRVRGMARHDFIYLC